MTYFSAEHICVGRYLMFGRRQNDVKGALCTHLCEAFLQCTYHITPFPIFQCHICMPWRANATIQTPPYTWNDNGNSNGIEQSNEKSNSFSFPIQNCKWYFFEQFPGFEWKIDIHTSSKTSSRLMVLFPLCVCVFVFVEGKKLNGTALINCLIFLSQLVQTRCENN